ncbi:MAG: L-rhamnose mutarotase [Eubacteriales bacterium]
MKKNNKFAWTWNIKPEYVDEYVRIHADTWQDVLDAHSRGGIHNYSIFQNGNQFFYCFECDDVKAAFQLIDQDEACQRWNAITSKMVDGSFDFGSDEPIRPLKQIFYLE